MTTTWRLVASSALLASLQFGCEDDAAPIPAVHEVFDFESGLAGWVADTAHVGLDQGDPAPVVELRSGVLERAGQCVWMATDNSTGRASQWLVRSWELDPGSYDVSLSWVSGPALGVGLAPQAIAAATDAPPRAFDSPEGHPGDMELVDVIGFQPTPEEPAFKDFRFEVDDVSPSPEGRIWTAVGYVAATTGEFFTCIDDLSVTITGR